MGLLIQTTGLDDYAPGGKARVKVLVIGGPGVGKTRWSSYFPKPLYADCEGGLASVADRKVPYVRIESSQDMSDLLAHARTESQMPQDKRTYQTLVVDTLDAYQRKVKDEWMRKEKKEVFTGWDAWGYVNSRMQLLMTRLLNLDMNVVVLVHYKDKTTKDDNTGKESHSYQLQVQGELGDTAFNDFDWVAWMGTYWEAVDGERVQKRGLTFKPTPDKPFLKDRLHVTAPWMEVTFADTDYTQLFDAIASRIEELPAAEVIGEVASEVPEVGALVIPPGALSSGAMPGAGAPVVLGYPQMDKTTLAKQCRDRGITTTVDGTPIKGNTLKAELIAALEASDAQTTAGPAPTPAPAGPPADAPADPQPPAPEPVAPPAKEAPPAQLKQVPEGTVDTATGELVDDTARAVAVVAKELGGVVDDPTPPPTPPAPAPEPVAPAPQETAVVQVEVCEDCGKDLAGEDSDFVKLSWIKFRKKLCEDDFRKHKAGQTR